MKCETYSPIKPVAMFNELISEDIQRYIARGITEQYERAYEDCYNLFGQKEAWGLLPNYRRTCIEDIMPDFAARIGSCDVKSIRNKAKNCYHSLILVKSGNRINIALTQSKIEKEEMLPRNAEFRKGYAKDPQMVMDFMEEDQDFEFSDAETVLYAIITHIPNSANEKTPGFIDIVFPDRAYKKIVGRIRLLNKFPDVVVEEKHEEIADDIEISVVPSIGIKKQA